MNAFSAVRAGYGLARLLTPEPRPGRTQAAQQRPRALNGSSLTVIRALGVRHLAQAGISNPAPTGAVLALGVEVDLLHATSMLALAALDHRWRRAALADSAVALGFAAAGVAAARHACNHAPPGKHTHILLAARDRFAQTLAERTIPPPLLRRGHSHARSVER
jgi:hypothetical protein